MNEKIMKSMGFGKEVQRVKEKKCATCGCAINMSSFRDQLSIKEYGISGMCQKCQDDIFGKVQGEDW